MNEEMEKEISLALFEEDPITSFSGEYRFLSNFWPAKVFVFGVELPSVEHAYVVIKCDLLSVDLLDLIKTMTPGQVKAIGRKYPMVENWDSLKDNLMLDFVRQKFNNPELQKLLLATGDRELVEGNTWNDTYWGQCPIGVGQNKLGKILMKVRNEIK